MWIALLMAGSVAHASAVQTAAWATGGTAVGLDIGGHGMMFAAAAADDWESIVLAPMGLLGIGSASVLRNTSIGLAMVEAKRVGADRALGWGAVGGTVASTGLFWGLPFAFGNTMTVDDLAVWTATGLLVRAGTYTCLGLQLRENKQAGQVAARLRLHVTPERFVVSGAF